MSPASLKSLVVAAAQRGDHEAARELLEDHFAATEARLAAAEQARTRRHSRIEDASWPTI